MIKKRSALTYSSSLCYISPKRPLSSSASCPIPLDSAASSPSTLNDHKSLCFSLVDGLIFRGHCASAQQVIQRLIASSPSVPDAIYAIDFAGVRRMDLDHGICTAFIRKLVESGELELARNFFHEYVIGKGILPNSPILNSMIFCMVKLGELDEAMSLFPRLIGTNDLKACQAACKLIIRGLLEQDRIQDAVDWLVSISKVYSQLDMCSYPFLITGLCNKEYMDEAVEVFDIMQERCGLVPTVGLFKSLFYGFCKRGWPVKAELFLEQVEKQGFFVDKVMYTALINAYCKDKKMKMAMRVLIRMLKRCIEPDTYTYNTVIHGFAKMGLFDKVQVLFNQLNVLGMQPNIVTYNLMISNYCRQGKVDCAERLRDTMVHENLCPNVYCYTSLFAALCKENKLDKVIELLESMLKSGVAPDHVLFFVLMKNIPNESGLPLSLLLLQLISEHLCGLDPSAYTNSALELEQKIELLLEGISRSNLNLANVGVAIYIIALCEAGKTNYARACFENLMNNADCGLSLFIINSLIKRLFQDRRFKDAKSLFDTMEGRGIVPNLATYNIMVNGYCKLGDLDAVHDVFCDMKKRRLKPDAAIYNSIIGCLSRKSKMEEAEVLFKQMLLSGVDADRIMYMTMANAYSRNGRDLEALQLFDMMKKRAIMPTFYCYTALITGLVKKGMIDKGCSYLSEMLSGGFVPNAALYTSLINHFLRRGELEFALRLIDLMDRDRIKYDLVFYIVLVSGIRRNIMGVKTTFRKLIKSKEEKEMLLQVLLQHPLSPGEKSLTVSTSSPEKFKYMALKVLQKMEGIRLEPNLYLHNVIISVYCWTNMIQNAYNQIELMKDQGICPNEVTFTILIDGCCRAGDIDSAVGWFNAMNGNGCSPDRIAYATLLKGICRARRGLDALSLLYAMQKKGFFPGKASYQNVLHCLCACSLSIPSFRIFEEMIAHDCVPRQYFSGWLLVILLKENKLDEAQKVLDILSDRGLSPHVLN